MVTTVIDPFRVPTINQSAAEIAEIRALMEAGKLPSDFLKRHIEAVDSNVFGVDAPKDRRGWRMEIGIGSPLNQSQQSLDAYIKYGKDEPDFERNLARMRKELEATEQRKAAERAASPDRGFTYGRPA